VEGVGVMGYTAPDADFHQALHGLIGDDPLSLYRMDSGRIVGRNPKYEAPLKKFRHLDGPLFDLIGKLTGKPAYRLLGDPVRDRVEAYDGTLYFSDVWFKDRGSAAVVEEVQEAQRSGYRGVKLKLGRGSKWMEKAAGQRRDIEVVRAVREAAGPRLLIMADPNNGYRYDRDAGWRLLSETAAANLHWIEEIFPENVADYNWLKDQMEKAGMKTFIADGESVDQAVEFEPYLKPRRLIDVLQPDIRRFGFLDNLKTAQMAAAAGTQSSVTLTPAPCSMADS
jgi:D-galactarolactone cycloisomerase